MAEPVRDAPTALKQKCIACGNDIDRNTEKCPICQSSQLTDHCDTCKKAIPKGAPRCNGCSTYQGKRRHLPFIAALALFVSTVFGLISGGFTAVSYLVDRNSDTKFKVTSIDTKVLHLKVWNTGRKPSRIVSYRLRFPGQLMIEDTTLYQADGDAVIQPGNPVNVGVTVKEFVRRLRPGSKDERYTKDEIRAWLSNQQRPFVLQIEAGVEESGHLWNLSDYPFVVPKTDQISADRIKDFILGRIPDAG